MSKTLVAIHSYPGANAEVAARWPWYEKAGADIIGIGTLGGKTTWPSGPDVRSLVATFELGRDAYAQDEPNLPTRLIDTLDLLFTCSQLGNYGDICVIEWDSIFTGLLPVHTSTGHLVTNLAGFGDGKNFHGSKYFHTPWWVDRKLARDIVTYGRRMLKARLFEHGFPDRFLGLMADLFELPWSPAHSFSVNTIQTPAQLDDARRHISAGAYYVHGLKTLAAVNAVSNGLL